jgi:Galactose binding lectin domain
MNPGTKQAGLAITGIFVVILVCALCIYIGIQTASIMNASPSPSPSSPSPSPGSGPLCASVPVSNYPSPASAVAPSLTITAPTGATISSIDYANFGNSTGVCGQFTVGECSLYDDTTILSLIRTACVGKNTCSVDVNQSTFGTLTPPTDRSCLNNPKLQVQFQTTGASTPAPAPSPAH